MAYNIPGSTEKPLLIKSETCPACRTATALLDSVGFAYTTLSNTDPAYDETVRRYGVRHVPTLILHPEGHSEEARQPLVGIEAIRGYVKG